MSLKSSEVRQDLLQEYRPDNWHAFEVAVDSYLTRQLAGMHIEGVRADITNSASPGPLILKFEVTSQVQVTAAEVKAVLRRV